MRRQGGDADEPAAGHESRSGGRREVDERTSVSGVSRLDASHRHATHNPTEENNRLSTVQ
jgi:hypothetical protein